MGLRQWLESQGHTYIVTHDKDGQDSELERNLADTDILISTPFHPAYLTPERFQKAKKLKLAVTSGVGSDHINLDAAREHSVTVVECTGSNVVSVAEHAIMSILVLIKNYIPAHQQIVDGGWDVSNIGIAVFSLSLLTRNNELTLSLPQLSELTTWKTKLLELLELVELVSASCKGSSLFNAKSSFTLITNSLIQVCLWTKKYKCFVNN